MVTARYTKPRTGLGTLPSRPRKFAVVPMSNPNSRGWATGEPPDAAPHLALANPNCSIATTPASVTTARLAPRTRSAEVPTIRPMTTAATEPTIGPQGNPIPALTIMCETANPETPASVTWTSDTCPTNPVITTSDRHTTTPMRETISAWR